MKNIALGVLAALAGAGAVYFLDPRQGPRRRAQLKARLAPWLDVTGTVDENDGLEPLSMTPPGLHASLESHRSRMLPALAVATPVAVAVGAVLLHRKGEDGGWLH